MQEGRSCLKDEDGQDGMDYEEVSKYRGTDGERDNEKTRMENRNLSSRFRMGRTWNSGIERCSKYQETDEWGCVDKYRFDSRSSRYP